MSFGDSVIVLLASSEDFTNESSVGMDRLEEISALLGEPTHIVADVKTHVGMRSNSSLRNVGPMSMGAQASVIRRRGPLSSSIQ